MRSLKFNSFVNAFKSVLQIAFPIITLPYISRILGVDNIGRLNFSITYVGYFSYLAILGIGGYSVRNGSALRDDKEKITNL